MVLLLAALVALAATTAESRISYRNHKVLEVPLQSDEHMQLISRLQQEGVDVWTAVAGRHAHLRVSPSTLDFVNETLVDAGLSPRVLIPDVQKVIDMEAESIQVAEARRGRASWVGKSFVRYNEIEAWINALPSTCGNRCAIKVIGKSYENRNIYVIRISDDLTQSGSRKVLFFESNIHAREWLSHASMAYIVQTMLDKYGTDAKITQAMKQYEWHFVVMSNPDGYEYTWTNDRVWRKTRTPYSKVCFGADPNRNFDDHHCGEGTSTNACSDIYCGPTPFSEKETQVLRDYSTSIASRLLSFQSVHAYSQLVLLPFAYTSKAYPPDFSELTRVANLMTNVIFETSKKRYTAGNVADLLYPAAGSSMDWARNKLNTKYPIAWEVRPSQNAPNGFVVAPTEIIPTGNELLQAFLVMSQSI